MKIFSDLHHEDLYYSLQLLFEVRFGFQMYRPIGLEWYTEKLWRVYDHPATANQYLSIEANVPTTVHGTLVTEEHGENAWINKNVKELAEVDGVYLIPNKAIYTLASKLPQLGITLETFKRTKFDLLICSMPSHLSIFKELQARFQPQAKLIFQAGNDWGFIDCPNLLTSSLKTFNNQHQVFYHQEFDTQIFKPHNDKFYQSEYDPDLVQPEELNPRSIVNLQHLSSSLSTLDKLQSFLVDWKVLFHGAGNKDGPLAPNEIPSVLRSSGFLWHVKAGGDGYGYNIHHASACGKPLIVNSQWIDGTTASQLCEYGKTALDIKGKTPLQIKEELEEMAINYKEHSQLMIDKFSAVCDFDKEYLNIKVFLENLK